MDDTAPAIDRYDWPHPCWIVSQPRTGSTWLCDLLNGAVGISSESPDAFHETYHPKIWVAGTAPPRVTKCHVHWIEEFEHIDPPPTSTRLIILTRDDNLAQAWSLLESSAAGRCHATTEDERKAYREVADTVRVSRKDFANHMLAIRRWTRLARLLFREHAMVEHVTYEQLRSDTPGTVERLMSFLAVAEWRHTDGTTLPLH